MESEISTMAATPSTVPTPKAGKTKKLVKKAKGAKAKQNGKPKAKAKKTKGPSKPRGESVRSRALKVILKKGGLTAAQTREALGISQGCKPTLDQEVERGHLKTEHQPRKLKDGSYSEAEGALMYVITAAGRKALEKGTVDPKRANAKA